ncbi:melanotransferrin [Latimeria chalumnae]|uniref:Melanotransferrin n=1 Tax=Latimeria chalumnae TaxID=7897 RepID=M3XI42_LATCH|nr:PREDICTED: melanotransferrin [Latimeria chalumnae]|eukprot:XP_014340192.1 PREDICTED: melanotransferrin [Latimeria chalumnae]
MTLKGLLVSVVLFHIALGMSQVRWCTISVLELNKCNDMKEAFRGANIHPLLSCVEGTGKMDCVQKIADNLADAVTLDGGYIYQAGKEYDLKPVVGEKYDQDVGTSYYAVAVVSSSNTTININNLRGKKSCHTGLNRTVGWNVPIGYLIDSGRMSVMDCNVSRAVSEFFSASCVPGANIPGYPESLCQLCVGDNAGLNKCEKNDQERYYSYSGAFRCLAESSGEVAFVKHTTVLENTDGRNPAPWAENLQSKNYQLLCRDGSRAEVSEWSNCHLAKVPSHAVVVRPDSDGSLVFRFLNDGQHRFKSDSNPNGFKMFDSAAYNGKDLLFKDSTTELVQVSIPSQTYQAWLGTEYLHAVKGLDCAPGRLPEFLRWCVLSRSEILKCADMATSFKSKELKPKIQCVSADSPVNCMEKIKKKEADAVTLDGGYIYTAGETYGLVPAAGESYSADDNGNMYYAVAVVKRSNSNAFTIKDLKGKKSCHTGYQRTAGWNIPIGFLIKQGYIKPKKCKIEQAVSEFFSVSCVPGANQKGFPPNLCELCIGDTKGNDKCARSSNEQYSGYSGAFRCLAEGSGDVAFIKHSTVFDNTDGKNPDPWGAALKSSEFQLLCPNGARADVDQYAQCNLAQVPAHAVMIHPDNNIYAVYGLLDYAQDYFGNDSNQDDFQMFDSSKYEGSDLIFKDSTVKITSVGEKHTYKEWLGKDYLESLEGLYCSGAAVSSVSMLLLVGVSIFLMSFCM